MNPELFIVPYDFTSVGDTALKSAIYLAKPKRAQIILLHLVDHESKIDDAHQRLEDVISKLDLKVSDGTVSALVHTGSIFDGISKVAEEKNATLIIMGTHGAVGMQKLFGSYAIKVISSSSVPFLIVQDGVERGDLKKILIPITLAKESLQIIHIASKIAIDFDAKIKIIAEKQNDPVLSARLDIYSKIIKKQFEELNIDYDIETIKLEKSFQKSIIEYAVKEKYDIIAAAHYTESLLTQFERFTQGLITNKENIPCLVLNAKALNSFYF